MRDISTPLLNVVETGQWAQKVLVRSDRQTDIHVCACIHICTALPSPPHPPLSVCIKFPLETRLKKEKQREVKQNTLLFGYGAAITKTTRPTVWSTVHSPAYSTAGR